MDIRAFFKEYRDTVLASAGIIIAIGSLFFTIWQGKEQIRHNHISVEPRVNAYFANDGRINKSGIYIINNGMGTAFVSAISVTVDGKKVNPINNNVFLGAVSDLGLNAKCFVVGGPRPNDSFSVGDETILIEARGTDKSCSLDSLMLMLATLESSRLDFALDIESIYGDKFRYIYSENKQVRIN
jgi:hypothetical protein